MKKALNILSLLGMITFCTKYYFLDKISLELAGGVMIFVVILAAMDSVVASLMKLLFTILGFGLFLADYFYDTNSFIEILQPIFVMIMALGGIYLTISFFFGSNKDTQKYEYNKKTGEFKKID